MSPTEIAVRDERCLRQTHVEGGYVISTIRRDDTVRSIDSMLGVLTAIVGDAGRADLDEAGDYETMVFPGDESGIRDWGELDFRRYDSEEEAREGHDEMVERWRGMPAGMVRQREEDDE